jgi:LysM repeat protein
VTTIQQVNCLPNHDIYVMQELWLPAVAHPSRPGCATYHTVVRGQTLYSIGRTYGVSPMTIATANCICNMNRIYAGQTLCIPTLQRPGQCCP